MAVHQFNALQYFLLLIPTSIAAFGLLLICDTLATGGSKSLR